jgi:phage terminase large subunit
MQTYDIHVDPKVFNSVYIPHINNLKREQIFYGGSSSGKSVFLAQRDVIKVLGGGRNVLVCRQVARTLRGSVIQEIVKVIKKWKLLDLFDINKTDGTITAKNGYQIVFVGLDDVEKLKSITPALGEWTDIRVEEATEIDKDSYTQLKKRQRGGSDEVPKTITLSFNPILQTHWIYKEFFETIAWTDTQAQFENDDYSILKTTYKDNNFLTEADKHDLENEKDSYYYNVYTLGNWGVLGHVIFTNWIVDDLSGMKAEFTNPRNGQDFGYSSDPAATVVTHYDSKKKIIYIYDEGYEAGLTNDVLAVNLKEKITGRIACDSAEPKSVADLQRYGISAYSVKKGKDSVTHGIQWLQQQTIIVDKNCINMRNELQQYQWKKDAGGNALPIPIDKNNHLIDALRYAYEDDMDYGGWLAL